jgi:hypothetical protein
MKSSWMQQNLFQGSFLGLQFFYLCFTMNTQAFKLDRMIFLEKTNANLDPRTFVQVAQIFSNPENSEVMKTGHEALMLIDQKGCGVIFGLNWNEDLLDDLPFTKHLTFLRSLIGRQGYIEHEEIDPQTTQKILHGTLTEPTGRYSVDLFRNPTTNPIVHDLPYKEKGENLYRMCCELQENPPIFRGLGNNCVDWVRFILGENGIHIPYAILPKHVHHKTAKLYFNRLFSFDQTVRFPKETVKNSTLYYNRFPPAPSSPIEPGHPL